MPRSHRSAILAAVGIALAATAYAQPVDQEPGSKPGAAEQQAEPTQNVSPPQRPTIQDLIERITRALESAIDEEEAERQREQGARDLKAQEDMALWAKWMLVATGAGVLVTGMGVLLVWRTLIYTRKAADHAKSAADAAWETVGEARSSTSAARRAAEITQEIGERQLRAYVNVTGARVIWGNGRSISVTITVKNGGQTPAYRVMHRIHMAGQEQSGRMLPPTRPMAKYDIGPGGEDSLGSIPIQANEDVWEEIRNRRRPLYVWGEIRYDDIFGKEQRTTRYRMVLGPMDDLLLPCPEGNEST